MKKSMKYKKELSGTFNLSDNSRFQGVYASQCYETFFTVYAKFNFDKNNLLESIVLKLINYKGPINLGFLHLENNHENPNNGINTIFGDKILKMDLMIRGATGITETIHKFDTSITKISKDNISVFLIDRILDRLNGSNPFKQNIFDSEFHYRSGEKTEPKDPVRGQIGHINLLTFSGNCEQSVMITTK